MTDDDLQVTYRPPGNDLEVDVRDAGFAEKFRHSLVQNGAPIAASETLTALTGGSRVVRIQHGEAPSVGRAARQIANEPGGPAEWHLLTEL